MRGRLSLLRRYRESTRLLSFEVNHACASPARYRARTTCNNRESFSFRQVLVVGKGLRAALRVRGALIVSQLPSWCYSYSRKDGSDEHVLRSVDHVAHPRAHPEASEPAHTRVCFNIASCSRTRVKAASVACGCFAFCSSSRDMQKR